MSQDNLQNSNAQDSNGKYSPKYPKDLGRPLQHDEMNYNLDLIGQVIQGYRVMGNGPAGELDLNGDVNKVLKLHLITESDSNLINAGGVIGEYVWLPSAVSTEGGGGQDAATISQIVANIKAGAINIGDVVPAGSTLQDVVEQLLTNTYNPTFQNPSFSLNDNVNNLQIIGDVINVELTFNFNQGKILGAYVNGVWEETAQQDVRAGDAISYIIEGNTLSNNIYTVQNHFVTEGNNRFVGRVQYAEGPQPIDSNNDNFGSRLPSAISPERSTQFEGVFPIFLGNSSNDFTQRALVSHSANNIECPQEYDETTNLRHRIAISNDMIGTKSVSFEAFNPDFQTWNALNASEFTATSTTQNVQGNSVNYTLYTKSSSIGGGNLFRIVF